MEQEKQPISFPNLLRRLYITYEIAWNVLLVLAVVLLCAVSFSFGVGAGYFASLVKDMRIPSYTEMKKDIYNYEETTHIYFANRVYLGSFRSDIEREEVALKDVSPYVTKAIIATEDEYFYEHKGVVPKAIIRALFQEATNSSLRTGGSTLTQQLVKNQILTNEVSFERKAKEILLALRLEHFFSKDEILEAYLNVVPFGRNSSGRNIAGIQAAAQGVFGVNAKDLNLAQAAFLAGLPQSPFGYTPFTSDGEVKKDLSPALQRMKTVLNRMKKAGYISERQYNEALTYDVAKHLAPPKPSPFEKYPWLTMEIEQRAKAILADVLAKKDGYTKKDLQTNPSLYEEYKTKAEKQLRQNGYDIYTTIDKDIYDRMQEVVAKYPYFGSDIMKREKDKKTGKIVTKVEPVEVGAMLIENQTGRIISFVGGRDYHREQLNHATQAYRSNGSTMKPLLVYAPAMEMGIVQPGSVIPDIDLLVQTPSGSYSPKNADRRTHGFVSVRRALQYSYNIPAVRTYMKTISQRPITYLEKMGFTSLTRADATNLSMALGALTKGVTVEENVNAYATFGNYGTFVDAYLIEKIVAKDGQVVYEHKSEPVNVFSPQTAYLTIDMMRDVIRQGTAASLPSFLKFHADWAGKTGTGQDNKDAWFVATNPNVTFGTWIGYDTPRPLELKYKGLSYSKRNLLLWAQLMNAAYDVKPDLVAPKQRFNMPGGIVRRAYCTVSGLIPSAMCEKAGLVSYDLYNAKFVPTEEDHSLTSGKFVEVNGKRYAALPTTPQEFTSEGVGFNAQVLEEWGIKDTDLTKLFPDSAQWKNVAVFAELKENGKRPDPPVAQLSGKTLTWTAHRELDVVGYRVYRAEQEGLPFQVAAAIKAGPSPSFTIPSAAGVYYVTAVDISGNESLPSNLISLATPVNTQEKTDNAATNQNEQ
ncbi:transglycosylase domain-containing protein [Anoxybacillus sp. J5B_2022]|uniref:transglycosylase domain-containing protein n=1 Tax=Anoxybacillus sp. J5B_2022 TaxID=3003246 RepID=UPI002285E47A|nr:transglycosylase domain-containing protein [Anoxybacillus sp. J5B_2022]MCZ0756637.1 transglycosylase domain-containing protein [Anoxybacillus sp. J5B_2022]